MPTADCLFARADELEADIKTVRGGDEAAALRRLEDSLRKLRAAFKEVKGLAEGAERAAAKCQVRRCPMPFYSPCWAVQYCCQRYRLHVRTGCFVNVRVYRCCSRLDSRNSAGVKSLGSLVALVGV